MSKVSKAEFTKGSGNVFLDLGFDAQEAEELLLKAHLFHKLQDAIRASEMTQVEVASLLGTDQSKVSKILRGKMSDFSVDRITSYLLKLRWDLRIEAQPAHPKATRGRVILGAESARSVKPKSKSAKRA
jgi:predicted XRE-type DNA-binding protein